MNLALLVRRPASAKFKLPRGRASKRGLNKMGKDPGDCLQVATTFVGQTRGVGRAAQLSYAPPRVGLPRSAIRASGQGQRAAICARLGQLERLPIGHMQPSARNR